jgi:hypothetical protein
MFPNSTLVTLSVNKTHGEGEDALNLKAGVCGLIVRSTKAEDGNHLYAVDFGPYGSWYCHHNELIGQDNEGWDEEEDEIIELPTAPTRYSLVDEPSLSEKEKKDLGIVTINLEADMAKRMGEIERGE